MFDKIQFAKKIKYFRMKNNLTLLQLSELADISYSYLVVIESGKSVPSVDVIVSLLNALKLDFKAIFDDVEYEKILESKIVNYCASLSDKDLDFFSFILQRLER